MALSTVQAAGILAAILATEQRRRSHNAARQQTAKRWHQFETTAAALLDGMVATTAGQKSVAERLAAWRWTPSGQRQARFPRLAPLLQQSRHAHLQAHYHCPDPERQWLGAHMCGLFAGQYYDGQVVQIDRDVCSAGGILPLQLLVRYEDGDHVHLDEKDAQAQAQAYQEAHRSQSQLFAELGTGTLAKRKRSATARYRPA